MKALRKRILALNLALLLLLSLVLPASATDTNDYCTLTILGGDGKTVDGKDSITIQIKKNQPFLLDDLFHKDNAYVDYYTQTVDGKEVKYEGNSVCTDLDQLTLTAHWVKSEYKVPIVYIDMKNDVYVIDGSKDGWSLPKQENGGADDLFLGWRTNRKPTLRLFADSKQKALTRSRHFYADHTAGSSGIIFDFNGKPLTGYNQDTLIESYDYNFFLVTETIDFGEIGKNIESWNTDPDGKGTRYAVSGDTVDGAETGIVHLYAQYAAESTVVSDYCTLTILGGDGKTVDGKDSITIQIKKNQPFLLDDYFHQDYAYVDHYLRKSGRTEAEYGRNYLETNRDEETLTCVWVKSEYKVPVVYTDMEDKSHVLDGSKDGWSLPKQENIVTDTMTDTFLGWDTNSKPYFQIHADSPQKALTRSRRFYADRTRGNNHGIVFDFAGENMIFYDTTGAESTSQEYEFNVYYSSTMDFGEIGGKNIESWNTDPDGKGTRYAVSGDTVDGAETGVVRLYAQYAAENAIPVYINSTTYKEGKTLYAVPGTPITLPDPGTIDGQKFTGWYMTAYSGNDKDDKLIESGETFEIPANATRVRLTANWLPEAPLVIGGTEYTIKDSSSLYYEADGNRTARFFYRTYEGTGRLYLMNYNGGAISLPCSTTVVLDAGYQNTITAESGTALSCTGTLELSVSCTESRHGGLTVNGAPNSPVLSAARAEMNNAAHTKLTAGTGGTIAGTEKLALQLNKTYTYTYQIGTDGKDLVLERDTNGLASLPAEAVSLTVEPKLITITVDGNGGTANGEPTRKLLVEASQRITLDYFGFTRPGYYCTGFNDKTIAGETSFGGDAEIKLDWLDTGFKEFLALDLNGEKVPDVTKQEHLYCDGPTGKQVLFVDYSSGKATIPTVGISNKEREILYWYTGEDGTLEGESSLQFVPGETVDETQLPKGSTLYAKAWGGYYTLYANGKTFSNGKKVVTTSSNYLPNFTATDGTVVHHYSTDPNDGEVYLPGYTANLPRGTKLYAFWQPEGTVPFVVEDYVNGISRLSAQAGRELTLPAPKTRPGLKLAYWECHVICRDNSGTVERHQPGETFAIPENAFEGNISAVWTLDGPVTIDGKEIEISNEKTTQAGDGWSMWFNPRFGMVHLTLDGYSGGSISLPSQTRVHMEGEPSVIRGTLSCADTLGFSTTCAYGQHSGLMVQADAGQPAICAPHVYFSTEPDADFGRAPHIKLTAGANARAFASPTDTLKVTGNKMVTYYGRTDSAEDAALTLDEQGALDVAELQVFHTEPQISRLTLDGNGGKTAKGETSITVDLEYGEGYSLRSTGFKKQHADISGIKEPQDGNVYAMFDADRFWPSAIQVFAPKVSLTVIWKELGYPYIAFRAEDVLKGAGLDSTTRVGYFNKNSGEIRTPDYVYADPASYGDLVYWFSSEDGTETADSHQYLPGELVSEPDDTTLYARSVYSGQIALAAPGTTFQNGAHVIVSTTLDQTLTSREGWKLESWNTEPDGSGKKYALDAKLETVKAKVLYAQWETKLQATVTEDTSTGEKIVTFTSKAGKNVRIEATNENDAAVPPEQARRVILAAYRNGQFLGMLPATAETGKIICRIPNDAKYDGCELKIFFLEGGKPTQELEIVRLYN